MANMFDKFRKILPDELLIQLKDKLDNSDKQYVKKIKQFLKSNNLNLDLDEFKQYQDSFNLQDNLKEKNVNNPEEVLNSDNLYSKDYEVLFTKLDEIAVDMSNLKKSLSKSN